MASASVDGYGSHTGVPAERERESERDTERQRWGKETERIGAARYSGSDGAQRLFELHG
jgi:hypothetical protein